MQEDDAPTLDTSAASGQDAQTLVCPTCNMRLGSSTLICPNDGTVVRARLDGPDELSGKYVFLEEIGAGGMGVVYKAEHVLTKRVVAIKMLLSDKLTAPSIMRFQREAQAASKLSHPNLVTTLDFGVTSQGRPYMVMDFLEGKTLQTIIKEQGKLSVPEAKEIFLQICDGLDYAHANGVLHRDLKPSNVLILDSAKSDRYNVKIVDFGIAKILNDNNSDLPTLTETGAMLGTPLYMSPELALGKELDVRSDIYSLGCVLYECLTGVPPVSGNNALETAIKHTVLVPTTLKEASFGGEFSDKVENLLKKSLEKEPALRYQTISEFKAALIDASADPIAEIKKAPVLTARNRLLQTILVSIALVGGLALMVREFAPKPPSQPEGVAASPSDSPSNAVAHTTIRRADNADSAGQVATTANLTPSKSQDTDTDTNRDFLENFEQIKATKEQDIINANGSRREIKAPVQLTEPMVLELARDHSIKELVFKHVAFNDKMLEDVGALPLESLVLIRTDISNKGLAFLNPRLIRLTLESQSIIDSGVTELLRLKNLQELSLEGNPISNRAVEILRAMKTLKSLNIKFCGEITGPVVDILVKMPLTELKIDELSLKPNDIARLATSPTLTSLECGCPWLNNSAVTAISKMKLRKLIISGAMFNDQGLRDISQMKTLRDLEIHPRAQHQMSAGIEAISTLPLSTLRFDGVVLSDQDAEVIGKMSSLKVLSIKHAKLTEAGYRILRDGLPHCNISVES